MELTGALVLLCLSLVTATPHGYGAKGGAIANAAAGAIAGAGYGETPLSIPNDGSYSGSFSKSSSSSYAASSASSSSSSYSFSGSGAYGGNSVDNNRGHGGCSFGNCQNSNFGDGNVGNGQVYGGNKAGAAAGAVAGSAAGSAPHSIGSQTCNNGICLNKNTHPCEGPNCNNAASADKPCTSGSCTGSAATGFNSNKCTSGQCNPATSSNNGQGSNDIYVDFNGSPQPQPTEDNNIQGNTYDGSNSQTHSDTNKPATYLTTPKEGTCTSPNCGSNKDTGSAYDKNKPSSYNVPIHGTYLNQPSQVSSCAYGNCGPTPQNTQSIQSGVNSCATGNCAGYPSNANNDNKPFKNPNDSQGSPTSQTEEPSFLPLDQTGGKPSQSPSYFPSQATNVPFGNVGASAASGAGAIGVVKPNDGAQKVPLYNSGFGGPPGFLKPQDFNTHIGNPSGSNPSAPAGSYKPTCAFGKCGSEASNIPSYYPGSPTTGSTSCSYGNCGSQPGHSSPGGSHNSAICSTGNCGIQHKPNIPSNQNDDSGSYKPVHSSGTFGGPPGILKPNDFNLPSTPISGYSPTAPSGYSPTGSSSQQFDQNNAPSETKYKPTTSQVPCSSGNCASQPSKPASQYGHKPSAPSGVYNHITCSSGNCGTGHGSSATFAAAAGGASSTSSSYYPNPLSAVTCTSGNCGSQSTYNIPPPSPCSSGNCGSQSNHHNPTAGQVHSTTSCTYGNCGNGTYNGAYAAAGASAYSGGFGGPPGVLKPYDDGKLTGSPHGSHGTLTGGGPATYGSTGTGPGSQLNSGAQATAVAGANAGAYGNSNGYGGNQGSQKGGCSGGCGSNSNENYGPTAAGGSNQPFGGAHSGGYGSAGSFAGSSASAHAYAGASAKGGYGRR